jgi:nitroreductase
MMKGNYMLTVKEAIEMRRSVRHYRDEDIPDDIIGLILDAARLAPSASNWQPWRFTVIRDKETKNELSRICWGQRFVAEAPVAIACFIDYNLYSREERAKRRQEMIESGAVAKGPSRFDDPKFREYLKSMPTPIHLEKATSLVANAYISITQLLLMATALGLGSCWVGGFTDTPAINRLFGLPENVVPIAVVTIGYPAGEVPPPRPRRSLSEIATWL